VESHPFQPLAAVVGAVLVALGVLVATFSLGRVDDDALVWVAIAAVLAGVALIPWRRRTATPALPDESSPDGE
jgi:hypothetical protein